MLQKSFMVLALLALPSCKLKPSDAAQGGGESGDARLASADGGKPSGSGSSSGAASTARSVGAAASSVAFRMAAPEISPKGIVDALNRAPKPVTLVAFLGALPGPLPIGLSTSEKSAQPGAAVKEGSPCSPLPRIFLFMPGRTVLSTTLNYPRERDHVEMTFESSGGGNIYMNIEFPVTAAVALDKVMSMKNGSGDTLGCIGCHKALDRAAPENPAYALANPIRIDDAALIPAAQPSAAELTKTLADLEACAKRESGENNNTQAARDLMRENALRLAALRTVGVVPGRQELPPPPSTVSGTQAPVATPPPPPREDPNKQVTDLISGLLSGTGGAESGGGETQSAPPVAAGGANCPPSNAASAPAAAAGDAFG